VKRIAIRTELGVEGQMDVDMDDMPTVETPSEDSSSFYTGKHHNPRKGAFCFVPAPLSLALFLVELP